MPLDEELLAAAELLITRQQGDRGRMSQARIRRSISTTYYAIFHFVMAEATGSIVGRTQREARRRRALARAPRHRDLTDTFKRLRGSPTDADRPLLVPTAGAIPFVLPPFLRELAKTFVEVQSQRHDADYDLNKKLTEDDARRAVRRVRNSIAAWRASSSPADRDLKHMVSILLLLQGKKGQN